MKNILKLVIAAALVVVSGSSLFAQKAGYINMSDLISLMPERDSVELKLERLSKEFQEQLEAIQVEYQNKEQDYQKNQAGMSAEIRQLKERELMEIAQRFQSSQEELQNSLARAQESYMQPLLSKAREAIGRVSKANGIAVVHNTAATGVLAWFDESALTDLMPLVKKELGLK